MKWYQPGYKPRLSRCWDSAVCPLILSNSASSADFAVSGPLRRIVFYFPTGPALLCWTHGISQVFPCLRSSMTFVRTLVHISVTNLVWISLTKYLSINLQNQKGKSPLRNTPTLCKGLLLLTKQKMTCYFFFQVIFYFQVKQSTKLNAPNLPWIKGLWTPLKMRLHLPPKLSKICPRDFKASFIFQKMQHFWKIFFRKMIIFFGV